MLQHLGKLAARFRNMDLHVLIAVLILLGGVLTFVTIADVVVTGQSRSWDGLLRPSSATRPTPPSRSVLGGYGAPARQ